MCCHIYFIAGPKKYLRAQNKRKISDLKFTNFLLFSHLVLICERYSMGDRLGDAKKGEAERGYQYPARE